MLLLRKYLSATQIEEQVCPTSLQLLCLEGIPEDIIKERHPDAFVVGFYSFVVHNKFELRKSNNINIKNVIESSKLNSSNRYAGKCVLASNLAVLVLPNFYHSQL